MSTHYQSNYQISSPSKSDFSLQIDRSQLLNGITKRHKERKELVHNIPNYTFGNAGEVRKRFSLLT